MPVKPLLTVELAFLAASTGTIMAVALHNAAPLKPEIQFVQALSEYEAILTDDQKTKFRTYHRQQPPDATDVMRFTAEIDRDNSHRKSRRCVGPRLTNILQAVQQFSTIVDTIVGGSQSQIACAIWGVLKMSIQVTSLLHFNCYR
jgi:ankyrin repeat domain-containing protein 50